MPSIGIAGCSYAPVVHGPGPVVHMVEPLLTWGYGGFPRRMPPLVLSLHLVMELDSNDEIGPPESGDTANPFCFDLRCRPRRHRVGLHRVGL